MKTTKLFLIGALALSLFTSCEDDAELVTVDTSDNEVKVGLLTMDETWTADKIYELAGRVVVNEGVTLTIMPGTIIKGRTGNGSLASSLIISRGAKLMAEGTASSPIIFTTLLDNIAIGQGAGTNLSKTDNQKWGGIIILGKAPVSAADGDDVASIEGIPADDAYGLYGGTDIADNSGSLKYISIRHGGASIGSGNEINGLTLGGVGNGTSLDNIEVYANFDDGIEFFGGSVNATNIMVSYQGDDAIDIDQNYSGTINNFAVIHGGSTDEGLEIDGPEGTLNDGLFTLKNGWIKTEDGSGSGADLKSKAQGTISNVRFVGYAAGNTIQVRSSFSNNCVDPKTDAYTYLTDANPSLKLMDIEFPGLVAVYTKSEDDNMASCPVPSNYGVDANAIVTSAQTSGADLTVFDWTLANASGLL